MTAVGQSGRLADSKGMAFALWGVAYIAARGLLELDTLGWWPRLFLALAPVPLFGWVLWTLARAVAGFDELQRRIQLEALAFAFPLTLVLIMTLGLLEIAIGLDADDWSYRHLWPLLVVLYLVGLTRAKRRYD